MQRNLLAVTLFSFIFLLTYAVLPRDLASNSGSAGGVYPLALGMSPENVACPANITTLIDSGNISPAADGDYFMTMQGIVPIQLGAVVPSQIQILVEITGSDGSTFRPSVTYAPAFQLQPDNTFEQGIFNSADSGNLNPSLGGYSTLVKFKAGVTYTVMMQLTPTNAPVTIVNGGFHNFLFLPAGRFSAIQRVNGGVRYIP